MRIVIDMQGLQTASRFRGIGRYTMDMVKALIRNRGNHEIILVLSELFPQTIPIIREAFKGHVPEENIISWCAPAPISAGSHKNEIRHSITELLRERFFADLRPDIIHITSLIEGFMDDAVSSIHGLDEDIPVSCMIYDLIPLSNPEEYLKHQQDYHDFYMNRIENLKKADLLLAISEYSKKEAEDLLALDNAAVVNISSAVDDHFEKLDLSGQQADALLQRLQLKKPFILYAGGTDPRKNLPRLIKSYAALPEAVREQYCLLFTGKMGEHEIHFFKSQAKAAGLKEGELCISGYVSDEELIALYNLCVLFVFPSWQEGFGLPALEAMRCGAPVIGSNRSGLPEVIGCAQAMFDPFDEKGMTDKMMQALTDQDFRKRLEANAEARSKLFCWDETAKRAIAAWEKLHQKRQKQAIKTSEWRDAAGANNKIYQRLIEKVGEQFLRIEDKRQKLLIETAYAIERNEQTAQHFNRGRALDQKFSWRLEGPFDSSYSLALLNRELARAIANLGHSVALHSTEGHGDFEANQAFLATHPDLAQYHRQAATIDPFSADITSRNLYPPRVEDMKGRINLLHSYGWEESGFPYEWTEKFNANLQGMTVMSEHVRKIMIDSGVSIPIKVAGVGVDHWERVDADADYHVTAKKFRFLHVSSCFPRKGADVMLEAYGKQFTASDDVTFIIKTFANPHNQIHAWLEVARAAHPDYPDVVIIEEDLSDGQLKKLYQQCHALVAPSRAEGFGLPLAEAMLSGLAVIATGWSGQLDFCTTENAWLVGYQFQPAQTHFELFNSVWAEPDVDDLAQKMRQVFDAPKAEILKRSKAARKQLLAQHGWEQVAQRNIAAAREFSRVLPEKEMRLGWVSSWNTRCGIASYSEHLLRSITHPVRIFAPETMKPVGADDFSVIRCWRDDNIENYDRLYDALMAEKINVVVIQFNYGFYSFEYFTALLKKLNDAGLNVILMMHATQDPQGSPHKKLAHLREELKRCARILVHSCDDLNRLKQIGLVENTGLFPHGIMVPAVAQSNKKERKHEFTVASYGFFLPHKGFVELIEAVGILRSKQLDVRLKMWNAEYPAPQSADIIAEARQKIDALKLQAHVSMNTDFLADEECIRQLSKADLIVFPYQQTAESSSAAVRYGITSGSPVAVTPLDIFKDVEPATFALKGIRPKDIAAGIEEFMKLSEAKKTELQQRGQKWRAQHSYPLLAQRLYGMLRGLNR